MLGGKYWDSGELAQLGSAVTALSSRFGDRLKGSSHLNSGSIF